MSTQNKEGVHIMGFVTPYRPIAADVEDLPMGYLLIDGELRWIAGSRYLTLTDKVLVCYDDPSKVLGGVIRANRGDRMTVYVPSTLADPETYSNVAWAVSQELGTDPGTF